MPAGKADDPWTIFLCLLSRYVSSCQSIECLVLCDASGAKPWCPSHNQINCGTRCSKVCAKGPAWAQLSLGMGPYLPCPRSGRKSAAGQENEPGVSTDTDMLIAVLRGHKHQKYLERCQQEKQRFMAQRGKHQEMGSYHLFCFTFPTSKLKIKM